MHFQVSAFLNGFNSDAFVEFFSARGGTFKLLEIGGLFRRFYFKFLQKLDIYVNFLYGLYLFFLPEFLNHLGSYFDDPGSFVATAF